MRFSLRRKVKSLTCSASDLFFTRRVVHHQSQTKAYIIGMNQIDIISTNIPSLREKAGYIGLSQARRGPGIRLP